MYLILMILQLYSCNITTILSEFQKKKSFIQGGSNTLIESLKILLNPIQFSNGLLLLFSWMVLISHKKRKKSLQLIKFLCFTICFTAPSLLKWGGALKGWSKAAEILTSRHRPQEWMSSSPCPLLAEEWNYPPLCAHTSFSFTDDQLPPLELTPTIYTHFTSLRGKCAGSFPRCTCHGHQ